MKNLPASTFFKTFSVCTVIQLGISSNNSYHLLVNYLAKPDIRTSLIGAGFYALINRATILYRKCSSDKFVMNIFVIKLSWYNRWQRYVVACRRWIWRWLWFSANSSFITSRRQSGKWCGPIMNGGVYCIHAVRILTSKYGSSCCCDDDRHSPRTCSLLRQSSSVSSHPPSSSYRQPPSRN